MTKSNAIKNNIRAFVISNKTYKLVKNFKKDFLNALKDETLENKLSMWKMCIKYMTEEFNKRLGDK